MIDPELEVGTNEAEPQRVPDCVHHRFALPYGTMTQEACVLRHSWTLASVPRRISKCEEMRSTIRSMPERTRKTGGTIKCKRQIWASASPPLSGYGVGASEAPRPLTG
eukprot:scaffold149_cov315-Pinguiococcus_pyrenoidosus.AAC.69